MRTSSTGRIVLALLVALAFSSGTARAKGLSLAWNSCREAGGASNLNFACDSNDGAEILFGTVTLDSASDYVLPLYSTVTLDIRSSTPQLPRWWSDNPQTGCRPLVMTSASGDLQCPPQEPNAFPLQGMVQSSYVVGFDGPNSARATFEGVMYAYQSFPLLTHSNIMMLPIYNTYTVGGAVCGGCDVPVTITLSEFRLHHLGSPESSDLVVTGPASVDPSPSNIVTWQTSVVPTRASSWGRLKSHYR